MEIMYSESDKKIISFIDNNSKEFMEALFLYKTRTPGLCKSRTYRMLMALHLQKCLKNTLPSDANIVYLEDEGKSWDCEIEGFKVSMKAMQKAPHPRPMLRGKGNTVGSLIMVKNVLKSKELYEDEFRYMNLFVEEESSAGLYLLSSEHIKNMLSAKDGFKEESGQIQIYPKISDYLHCILLKDVFPDIKVLEEKYPIPEQDQLNAIFKHRIDQGISGCIDYRSGVNNRKVILQE